MQAEGKHSVTPLSDEQVAIIFEAAAIPMDDEGRRIAEELKAAVVRISRMILWLDIRPDIGRLETVRDNLRRTAEDLLAAPQFIESAFEDPAVAWMIESDLARLIHKGAGFELVDVA